VKQLWDSVQWWFRHGIRERWHYWWVRHWPWARIRVIDRERQYWKQRAMKAEAHNHDLVSWIHHTAKELQNLRAWRE
jgi:hypothetical protein